MAASERAGTAAARATSLADGSENGSLNAGTSGLEASTIGVADRVEAMVDSERLVGWVAALNDCKAFVRFDLQNIAGLTLEADPE
jgi:hypothetical protein